MIIESFGVIAFICVTAHGIYVDYHDTTDRFCTEYICWDDLTKPQILNIFKNLIDHKKPNYEMIIDSFVYRLRRLNKYTPEIELFVKLL
jgi:hypothetical protein